MFKKLRLKNLEYAIQNRHQTYVGVKLHSEHSRIRHRNRYASEKEPDLVHFLDRLPKETIFWDVGANVGFFSIYAAKRGMRVLAFEPDQLTCGVLNRNIFLNGVSDRCIALPIALNDSDVIDVLSMKEFLPANAYNTFGRQTNEYGRDFVPVFSQGSVGLTGDGIRLGTSLAGLAQPSFVKIDVDGNELKVVAGMKQKLSNARFVCIELSKEHPETVETVGILSSLGFRKIDGDSLNDSKREEGGIRNHYFERSNSPP
jgi:FkbM family methyltransferase